MLLNIYCYQTKEYWKVMTMFSGSSLEGIGTHLLCLCEFLCICVSGKKFTTYKEEEPKFE